MQIDKAALDRILYRVSRPARYTGGEWNSVTKDWEATPVRTALIYPDVYEIGMSNMALPILYRIINDYPEALAERCFAPWPDMAALLREEKMPLFSLESRRPLAEFDVIGFSLGYELTYTNVLEMLDLAGVPVPAAERGDDAPLVMAGGSGAFNPEPMSDFIDFFVVGDAEEALPELLEQFRGWKETPLKRQEKLRRLATIPGIYVPSLYEVEYEDDGRVKSVSSRVPEAPPVVKRRIVAQLPPPVTEPVVPLMEVIHDRAAVEIQRGCSHGCRFCQAGVLYRPLRVRPGQEVLEAADSLVSHCGYNEVSLVSLSTSDYPEIREVAAALAADRRNLAISLPSLYINSFSVELLDSLRAHKKTGLTFAPEAGTERLRQVINKHVSEENLMEAAASAFRKGWTGIKLYFMVGLPGETLEDVQGIIDIVNKLLALGRQTAKRTPQIRLTVSTFVPKPHTPFQWAAQDDEASLEQKQQLLKDGLRRKGVKLSWSDTSTSRLEAALSRGDRRTGKVIYNAWRLGCVFDSWNEYFDYARWLEAFEEAGLDPTFYALRERPLDEVLPWSHIDPGVSVDFLKREYRKSLEARQTGDCRYGPCNACGLEKIFPACREKLAALKRG